MMLIVSHRVKQKDELGKRRRVIGCTKGKKIKNKNWKRKNKIGCLWERMKWQNDSLAEMSFGWYAKAWVSGLIYYK